MVAVYGWLLSVLCSQGSIPDDMASYPESEKKKKVGYESTFQLWYYHG